MSLDMMCVKAYGFTYDFFNELKITDPSGLSGELGERYLQICTNGEIRTYTDRYRDDDPRILEQSNPTTVMALDGLVEKLPELGREGDLEGVKVVLEEIFAFRKRN